MYMYMYHASNNCTGFLTSGLLGLVCLCTNYWVHAKNFSICKTMHAPYALYTAHVHVHVYVCGVSYPLEDNGTDTMYMYMEKALLPRVCVIEDLS